MLLRDLIAINKDWQETTDLIIVSKDDSDPAALKCRVALSLFGDRQVLWFRDCVVMLF